MLRFKDIKTIGFNALIVLGHDIPKNKKGCPEIWDNLFRLLLFVFGMFYPTCVNSQSYYLS